MLCVRPGAQDTHHMQDNMDNFEKVQALTNRDVHADALKAL